MPCVSNSTITNLQSDRKNKLQTPLELKEINWYEFYFKMIQKSLQLYTYQYACTNVQLRYT